MTQYGVSRAGLKCQSCHQTSFDNKFDNKLILTNDIYIAMSINL